jgi:NAD(P)-dependent dehydrogenase (short-subunit alcohol dehydrogenase family)
LQNDWPTVDTVVLCAGVSESRLSISNLSDMPLILRVNLQENIRISTRFLQEYQRFVGGNASKTNKTLKDQVKAPAVTNHHSFCLVTISSLLANKGGFGASTYAASKAGLIAFNRALSLEAGALYKKKAGQSNQAPAFRVNTVLPGYIDTPMTKGMALIHHLTKAMG